MQGTIGSKFGVVMFVVSALFAVVARQNMLKKQSQKPQGSVADLVRRGQLRSDRRGMYVVQLIIFHASHAKGINFMSHSV